MREMMSTADNIKLLGSYLKLLIWNQMSSHEMVRKVEDHPVTAGDANVLQYDEVMSTRLAIPYVIALETIYRSLREEKELSVIDLACGPGRFTRLMSNYLRVRRIHGVDLSPRMIDMAIKNSAGDRNSSFSIGDITDLSSYDNESFDLSCFTDAAHHLTEKEDVASVVQQMERITSPNGTVMIMDLARLRSESITNAYVKLVSRDYGKELEQFRDDFRQSMFAAWTTQELASIIRSIPTRRTWWHFVPIGLPAIQLVVGLPTDTLSPLIRTGVPWSSTPLAAHLEWEWRLLRLSLITPMATRKLN